MFFFEYILESNLKKKHRGVLKRICPSKILTISGGSRFNRALLIHRSESRWRNSRGLVFGAMRNQYMGVAQWWFICITWQHCSWSDHVDLPKILLHFGYSWDFQLAMNLLAGFLPSRYFERYEINFMTPHLMYWRSELHKPSKRSPLKNPEMSIHWRLERRYWSLDSWIYWYLQKTILRWLDNQIYRKFTWMFQPNPFLFFCLKFSSPSNFPAISNVWGRFLVGNTFRPSCLYTQVEGRRASGGPEKQKTQFALRRFAVGFTPRKMNGWNMSSWRFGRSFSFLKSWFVGSSR